MNKNHPYFADVEPDNVECFSGWIPSYQTIFSTDKINCAPIVCFKDHEQLILSLIENDPSAPISIYPMESELFNDFAYDGRLALARPPSLDFEHEDSVIVICVNPNGYPTGEWFEASINYQDTFYADFNHPGLKKGWSIIVLDIFNQPNQKPNNSFLPPEVLVHLHQ